MNVLTVWSRDTVWCGVVRSHLALDGVIRRVHVFNGLKAETRLRLERDFADHRCTFITSAHRLPIARAYNLGLRVIPESEDVLEYQDDIVTAPSMVMALASCEYDVAAGWHNDRSYQEAFEFEGMRYTAGMCMLLRARVRQRIGFHCELFINGVDGDYGMRAHEAGFTCGHLKNPRVKHLGRVTTYGNNEMGRRFHEHGKRMTEFLKANGLQNMRYEPQHADFDGVTVVER